MRKNFGPKTWMYPQPVLILATYNEDGTPNAMNAAWGCMSDVNQIAIYVDKRHKTAENILNRKAYTVSMAVASQMVPCDYVGVVSGNNQPDKFSHTGWTTTKSEHVDAPVINELPMTLECKLLSYDEESELMLGEIVNVSADESILTEGVIDPAKLQPIAYDSCNHAYVVLGSKVGNAFKDGFALK